MAKTDKMKPLNFLIENIAGPIKLFDSNMSVKRGFTTLQLLHLAAIAHSNRTGLKGGNLGAALEAEFGIQLPRTKSNTVALTAANIKDALTKKAGWFYDGKVKEALRAKEGMPGIQIEARRASILAYVNANINYIVNQASWPTITAFGRPPAPNAATGLDDVLSSSWKWPSRKVIGKDGKTKDERIPGTTFQDRAAAVQAVLRATGPEEPADVIRSGGAGVSQPFTTADAQAKAAATSGFQTAKLANYIAGRVGKLSREFPGLGEAFTAAIMQAVGGKDLAEIKKNVKAFAGDRLGLRNVIMSLANNQDMVQKRMRPIDALWALGSASAIGTLISGSDIYKPNKTVGWPFNAAQPSVNSVSPGDDFAATRYAFDALYRQFLQSDSPVDILTEKGQNRVVSQRERAPGGMIAETDATVTVLSLNSPEAVTEFVGKALQGAYSMPALQAGAAKLGIAVPQDAISHKAVAMLIADGVYRAYRVQADSGSLAHVAAVAAARGIKRKVNGKTKGSYTLDALKKDTALVQEALNAVKRDVQAEYGEYTGGDCRDYTLGQLQDIAKRSGLKTTDFKNKTDACLALEPVIRGQTVSLQPLSSGRRTERVAAPKAASTSRSSGRPAQTAATQAALNQLSGTRIAPLSPRTPGGSRRLAQATQAPLSPRTLAAQQQPIRPSLSPSGRRLSQPNSPRTPGGVNRPGGVLVNPSNQDLQDFM